MKIIKQKLAFEPIPPKDRTFLPKHNVCSTAPATESSDYLYTGNGSYRLNVSGRPYADEIIVNHEMLYEPLWEKTPLPPDLRPYIKEIREHVLAGEPEKADALIDRAQREAGYGSRMRLDDRIVYPMGSLHQHKAFSLNIKQKEAGLTHNYLRWLDMYSGETVTHWENNNGVYENHTFASYQQDCAVIRLQAPKGKLDAEIELSIPGTVGMFGQPVMVGSTHTLTISPKLIRLAWGYNPEYGKKGYLALIRVFADSGEVKTIDNQCSAEEDQDASDWAVKFHAETNLKEKYKNGMPGICVNGGTRVDIYIKVIRVEKDFTLDYEDEVTREFLAFHPEALDVQEGMCISYDEMLAYNREYLSERMGRSFIRLGKEEDYLLSGEELLRLSHTDTMLYPMLMEKLYDMGRFYQIIDTGKLPPMWGQHNINTNLQVCAGNNTGLFEEMDVYFHYYENKFEDFRTNARLLFGARGMLASVHCDYDSGLLYHFSRTYPHYCWTGCLGWIYNELWGYYLVTGDVEFLRKRIVPVYKEIALFFEDYACLRDENDKVIFCPSFSPENPTPNPGYETVTCKNINPTRINSVMDIAICREVLNNLLEAGRILYDVEGDSSNHSYTITDKEMAHWREQLDSLPDYLLDEEGGLKEWAWPTIEENYNHRHVSHHYDLWPGRAVMPDTEPELAEAIRISNRKRGQQDDSAHGIIHRVLCAIRLRDREEMEQSMSQLIAHGFVRRNLSTAHFPYRGQFPDLQGAMPAILLEMCVFSVPGRVELLPALPEEWKTGSIDGIWLYIRAKLIHMEWDEDSITAEIRSDAEQTLQIIYRTRQKNRPPVLSDIHSGKMKTF